MSASTCKGYRASIHWRRGGRREWVSPALEIQTRPLLRTQAPDLASQILVNLKVRPSGRLALLFVPESFTDKTEQGGAGRSKHLLLLWESKSENIRFLSFVQHTPELRMRERATSFFQNFNLRAEVSTCLLSNYTFVWYEEVNMTPAANRLVLKHCFLSFHLFKIAKNSTVIVVCAKACAPCSL